VVLYVCETWSLILREEYRLGVTDVFWDAVLCDSGQNRRFGEHITSIFRFLRVIGFHNCVTMKPQGTKSQKISIIDTAVKTSENKVLQPYID
jgi:hypothetical protein